MEKSAQNIDFTEGAIGKKLFLFVLPYSCREYTAATVHNGRCRHYRKIHGKNRLSRNRFGTCFIAASGTLFYRLCHGSRRYHFTILWCKRKRQIGTDDSNFIVVCTCRRIGFIGSRLFCRTVRAQLNSGSARPVPFCFNLRANIFCRLCGYDALQYRIGYIARAGRFKNAAVYFNRFVRTQYRFGFDFYSLSKMEYFRSGCSYRRIASAQCGSGLYNRHKIKICRHSVCSNRCSMCFGRYNGCASRYAAQTQNRMQCCNT